MQPTSTRPTTRVAQVIKAAVQEAKDAPFPDPVTAFTDVWADGGSAWRN